MHDVRKTAKHARKKSVERAFGKSEARFRQVVESAPNAMVVVNAAGSIEMVNVQAEHLFGYSRTELLGQPLEILVPERFRGHHAALRMSFFATPESRPMGAGRDLSGLRKDGSEFSIEIGLNPIETEEGTMVLSAIVDISERRRLMAESGYLAAIVESSSDAIISKNLAGFITTWNPAAVALFGYTADEVIGRHISLLLPQDRLNEEDMILTRVRTGERVDHFETVRRRKDGREIAVSLTISPIRDPSGKVIGASKIVRDITERAQSEQQVKRERDLAQAYLDVAAAMILVLDTDANIALINRRGSNILGYDDPRELIGKPWMDLFIPKRLENELREAFRRVVAREEAHREFYDYPILTKTGEERLIAWHTSILTDGAGRVTASLSSGEDITERERGAEELRRANEMLSKVIAAAPMAIYAIDSDGRNIMWNPAVEKIYGIPASAAIGKSWRETAAGRVPPGTLTSEELVKTAMEQDGFQNIEIRRTAADGTLREINISSALLRDANAGVTGILFVAHDISEAKETEKRLRQAQKMEAIGQLTGGIAHDFNNLLAIIHGNLELISERKTGDPDIDEMAGDALRASARGANLTHQLLAYSRQQPLTPKVVRLERLVSEVTNLLRRALGETIEIKNVVPSDLWLTRIDPNQLENALLNLAVNARDAMPSGGKLTIEGANTVLDEHYAEQNVEVTPGSYVLLAVTDSGTGMSEEILDRVLEPFFTTKSVGQGTGLGLSMVYGFVKQSGGHLKIYSEPGRGTTINLYLPKAEDDADQEAAVVKSAVPRSIEGEVILVLEDDEMVRKFAVRVLTELGYRTIQAADGPDALRLLEEAGRIDLLLTDVMLPKGMSGPDVARSASVKWPDIKVLYMSGYAKDAIVNNGVLDEGVHLLTKPFPKNELARKVREILDGGMA